MSLAVAVSLPPTVSANESIRDVVFVPPAFTVGDPVEVRVVLEVDTDIRLAPPEYLPDSDWAEIDEIRIDETGETATVTISFVSFAPGTRSLPPLDLGGLLLPEIKVSTASLLDDGAVGPRGIRGPLLLPGTRLALALILALAVAAPPILYAGVLFLWRWAFRLRDRYLDTRSARRLRRLIKRLRSGNEEVTPAIWYTALTEELRSYLSGLTGTDCRSATTAEIAVLPGFEKVDTPRGTLLSVLKIGDLVKFAGRKSRDNERLGALDAVEEAMRRLDKDEDDADL
jgi:hypothetical protein